MVDGFYDQDLYEHVHHIVILLSVYWQLMHYLHYYLSEYGFLWEYCFRCTEFVK